MEVTAKADFGIDHGIDGIDRIIYCGLSHACCIVASWRWHWELFIYWMCWSWLLPFAYNDKNVVYVMWQRNWTWLVILYQGMSTSTYMWLNCLPWRRDEQPMFHRIGNNAIADGHECIYLSPWGHRYRSTSSVRYTSVISELLFLIGICKFEAWQVTCGLHEWLTKVHPKYYGIN